MPSNEVVFLQANGALADPRARLLPRAKLDLTKAKMVAGDDTATAPIADSGVLTPDEVYRDPTQPSVGYVLPRYGLELISGPTPVQLRLEVVGDAAAEQVGRLWVRLSGPLVPLSAADKKLLRLQHDVSLALRYLAREASDAPDAAVTWKNLQFETVVRQADGSVEASVRLATLSELDALHFALRDQASRCELTVGCTATLAVLRRYVRKLPPHESPPVFERVPPAARLSKKLAAAGDVRQLDKVVMRPELTKGGLQRPRLTEIEEEIELPDGPIWAEGDYGYMNVRRPCEQSVSLYVDPALHPYVFPARAPSQGTSLIRYTVPPEQAVIFQDGDERHVFYFIPDEFRLTREDVATPTYKPALHVDLFSLGDSETEWGATLTFRAAPYMASHRERDALDYIEQHKLVPDGHPVAWLPLVPEWTALQLTVPNDNGTGVVTVERPSANVAFDHFIVDSVTMTSSAFSEVFSSMRAGGETLNGQVKYRLSGSTSERSVPLSGRLDKLVGPVVRAELVANSLAADGVCKVRLSNAVESPIVIKQLLTSLLDAPDAGRWARAILLGSPLPLSLAPGQGAELSVQLPGLSQVCDVRVSQVQADVALDFAELWLDVLDEPGWEDIVQDVTASVDPSFFAGERAIEQVSLSFAGVPEPLVLSASKLSGSVRVVRPLLAYLLKQPGADAYVYQMSSLRRSAQTGELVIVAQSPLTTGNGAALTVMPPLS